MGQHMGTVDEPRLKISCSYFNRLLTTETYMQTGFGVDEAAHRMSPVNVVAIWSETLGGGDLSQRTVFCSLSDISYTKHVHTIEEVSFGLGWSVSASCTVSTGLCLVQVSLCSLLLICCSLLLFSLCTDSQPVRSAVYFVVAKLVEVSAVSNTVGKFVQKNILTLLIYAFKILKGATEQPK